MQSRELCSTVNRGPLRGVSENIQSDLEGDQGKGMNSGTEKIAACEHLFLGKGNTCLLSGVKLKLFT
uniref:Uncharacterized protein n=1 Tax=Anguilla anguilla TaxID=7936 RepID=A0A0E9WXX1_ANGAN